MRGAVEKRVLSVCNLPTSTVYTVLSYHAGSSVHILAIGQLASDTTAEELSDLSKPSLYSSGDLLGQYANCIWYRVSGKMEVI
jgi:hypothetical protein